MGKVPRRFFAVPVLALFVLAGGLAAAQRPAPPPPDKVPEDFPKDCPIYKDATVRDYTPAAPNNPKFGTVLVIETTDPKATVMTFYRRELPANGWKLKKLPRNITDTVEGTKGGRLIKVTVLEARKAPNPATLIHYRVIGKN
jgi:hypothetical protein